MNITKNRPQAFLKMNLWIFFFLFSFIISAQTAQNYSQEIESRIQSVEQNLRPSRADSTDVTWPLSERMAFYNIPAVSIAVIKNYQLDWAKAYGWADKEAQRPATPNTLFQAASISKSINALGVLHWAETNNIDLDVDINTHLKSWKLDARKKANGKTISLANILSHTAGLSGHGFNGYQVGSAIPTTTQILNGKKPANSKKVKSIMEPNTEFKYSGGGITITQLMLTENTGIAYDDYMKDAILTPLGMTSSFYAQPQATDTRLATAHWMSGNPLEGKFHIYPEMAAASLWTNPTELSAFIIEIQKSFKGASNTLLSEKMTKKMLTPHLESGNTGLGVFFENLNDRDYFSHGGSNEGFKCMYFGSMEDGNGIVIMVNSENFDIIPEILRSIITVYEW